jgi:hypothetical protein
MTILVEHLKSKEQFDEMTAFLSKTLDASFTIQSNLLYAMWDANAIYVIVNRMADKTIEGVQVWLAVHDPLHGGQRLTKKLVESGITSGFESARDIAFSMFEHGSRMI